MASRENTDDVADRSSTTPDRTLREDIFSSSVTLNKDVSPHNDDDPVIRGDTMVDPSSINYGEEAQLETAHTDGKTVTPVQGSEKSPKSEHGSSDNDHERPYSIFSRRRKRAIAAMSALSSALSPLAAISYFPALNSMRQEFNTSVQLINTTVTVYIIFQGLSPSFWGSLADLWGRRPVYIMTLTIYVGACIGLALAPNYAVLLAMRILQPIGSSSTIAIGAGIMSDIALPSERGGFYGFYSMGQVAAPVIGPVVSGLLADKAGWRWIFWWLAMLGLAAFLVIFFFLPETLRSLVGDGSGYANPTPHQWIQRKISERAGRPVQPHTANQNRFTQMPNMLAPFRFLLERDVLVALTYFGLHFSIQFAFMTSAANLFQTLYGLDDLQIGLTYMSKGVGHIAGSLTIGRILDHNYNVVLKSYERKNATLRTFQDARKSAKIAKDFPIYHARLRSLWISVGVCQIVTIVYGWCFHVRAHISIILLLQALNGFGTSGIFTTFQTLLVDLFPGKGASITASGNLVRCAFSAIATAIIEPGIKGIGVGWIFTVLGIVLVLSNVMLPMLLKFGPRWRLERFERERAQLKENQLL
ncbi:major facilitator superfamily domain-containing protein [Syncephalastrum racemosum]|uniref:Major facilitator superfamily domain-containing protein n=1 Tax=Syncephalastrum racemosum TaxID=13706 RepID=A0A1X2HUU1_SYNRA|nr:major facilitator superfamily domain-containing protein [Syncephalastrum racemosum]